MRAILTYHSIDSSGSPISVDASTFRRQVEWLAAGWVRVVALEDLLDQPSDVDAVSLTFDDAFENFGTIASPLLEEHGLPSTVFVVTDRAGQTNQWDAAPQRGIPTLPLL